MSEQIARAASILRQGGLVAFPTETVYGLGADATSREAIRRVFAVKGRPSTNPLIIHVAGRQVARRYAAAWPAAADKLAQKFWPGPLTLVVPRGRQIVKEATAGLDTVGLRAPSHPLTLALLEAFDGPLAGPSANRSTHLSPTTAAHVQEELGDSVDMILDGGPCRVGIESTVLDLSGVVPTILRPGAIAGRQIEEVIGHVSQRGHEVDILQPSKSPGRQLRHYAPRTPAHRFDAEEWPQVLQRLAGCERCAVIVAGSARRYGNLPPHCLAIELPGSPADYAAMLYATLRDADAQQMQCIWIEMPPDEPAWTAVRDRLRRATQPV